MYQVVALAPESVIEDLRKLRAQCPRSGVPVPDCHLALTPLLDRPPQLSADLAEHPAFSVRTTEPVVAGGDIVLPVEPSAALWHLMGRLGGGEAVVPILRQLAPDQIERAISTIIGWRVNYSWVVRDVDVIGLHEGKIWRSLARLNFGRVQPIL